MAIDPAASEHDLAEHLLGHSYPFERETMADVSALLGQVAGAHGDRHPELHVLEGLWAELCRCLGRHRHDERPVLASHVAPEGPSSSRKGPSSGVIASQHEEILGLVRRVRGLTGAYTTPVDGCDAYRSLFASLKDFDEELREHVKLADSVLRRAGER